MLRQEIDMNFIDLVRERRSIRKYQNKPVEKEKIMLCLETVRLAPSACNSQPYKFFILDNKDIKNKFASAVFSGIYLPCKFAAQAPVLIILVRVPQKITASFGNKIQNTNFSLIDLGIAGEHFALQAQELGLGSCWIGWFDKNETKKFLNLKEDEIPEIIFSLGYPAENPPERKKKNINEIAIFWEKK